MQKKSSLQFVLNGEKIETTEPAGMVLLDFIRKISGIKGTKIGCREGDCGACTVLVGELGPSGVEYHTQTSCLTPLGNAHAKHIVTVEGLNRHVLTPVQDAICEHGAAQCGFCTVGFVMSLTAYCLSNQKPAEAGILSAMDGNICRCTGYQALKRAASAVLKKLAAKPEKDSLKWLVQEGFVPEYFLQVRGFLEQIPELDASSLDSNATWIGGGTDLNVQKPDAIRESRLNLSMSRKELKGIEEHDDQIVIGAATTTEEIRRSSILQRVIPNLVDFTTLIASTPIRNMATVAGNLVNASPIGDLSIIFLALDAQLELQNRDERRTCRLRDFFLGYKALDLGAGEYIRLLTFPTPGPHSHFRFEKVSKRTHLDIASVNSAAALSLEHDRISKIGISAGGVAPIPLFLEQTCLALQGQPIDQSTIQHAAKVAMEEIAPISDIRGSAQYKRLLLRQLIFAHFLTLFPETIRIGGLV